MTKPSMLSLSYWFSSSTPAATQALVQQRTETLAENTTKIDEIAKVSEQLKKCFETVKAANPTLFETLQAPSERPITAQEMGQMLKALTLMTVTDLPSLGQDLEAVRQKRDQLEQLVQIWHKIEADFDAALTASTNAEKKDKKNVEDLTELLKKVQAVMVSQKSSPDGSHGASQ